MLYAGLDLSRKRLDFHLLDADGATIDVGASPPDADGLRGLSERLDRHGEPIRAAIESMNGARFVHDRLERVGWQVEIADAQPVDLAGDPLVTPARVLAREAEDEFADRVADRRSTKPAGVRPAARNQAAMPTKQRGGRHHEQAPAAPGQQPACGREQHPVAGAQLRPAHLPPQHRQLMPQHDDLRLPELFRTGPVERELQQAAQRQIAKRPEQEQLLEDQKGTGMPTLRATQALRRLEPN